MTGEDDGDEDDEGSPCDSFPDRNLENIALSELCASKSLSRLICQIDYQCDTHLRPLPRGKTSNRRKIRPPKPFLEAR